MKSLIQKKLEQYKPESLDEELMALKEITQELILFSLQKVNFFDVSSFMGGTALRIVHGLDRFSEDLDFSTHQKMSKFDLEIYLQKINDYMRPYGYDLSYAEKDLSQKTVQNVLLKDESIKKIIHFQYKQDIRQKIKIKIEIDTNPPLGAKNIGQYLHFPESFVLSVYDLSSLMSGKIHALLCRPYSKGRDWYDLIWYISQNIELNSTLLANALFQLGPWKGKKIHIDLPFVKSELLKRVSQLNWNHLKDDAARFLKESKKESLELWNEHFFRSQIERL